MNWNLIISLALLFGFIGLLPVVVVFGVRLMRQRCPACEDMAHWGDDCNVDGCACACRGD